MDSGKTTQVRKSLRFQLTCSCGKLQNDSYRASFAGVAMKQSHYLRRTRFTCRRFSQSISPDKHLQQHQFLGLCCLLFCKNAFAGYVQQRGSFQETDGGKLKVLSDAVYADFSATRPGRTSRSVSCARTAKKSYLKLSGVALNKPFNVWVQKVPAQAH